MTIEEVNAKLKWQDEVAAKLSAEGWQEIWSEAHHCQLFRRVENGRGKWLAAKDGEVFPVTWEQAVGYEPITSAEKMAHKLGAMLLPR